MSVYLFLKKKLLNALPDRMLYPVLKSHYLRKLRRFSEDDEIDIKVVRYLVRTGDSVIDVGANIGVYTVYLSKLVGPNGNVYSIEPIPPTFDILSNNVKKLGQRNVWLLNYAISDQCGSTKMEIPKYLSGGENYYQARIRENGNVPSMLRRFDVVTTSLDTLLFGSGRLITFMKIDVEGHESQVIKGSLGIIRKYKPALLIEISGDPDDDQSKAFKLFGILRGEGYSPYWFDGRRLNYRIKGNKSVNYFLLTHDHISKRLNSFIVC